MSDDASYYLKRAEAQLALAQAASHPAAAKAHYHLAGHYLDRAYSVEIGAPLKLSAQPHVEKGPIGYPLGA